MQLLQSKGVHDMVVGMVVREIPLVGQLQHFLSNWQNISQDKWVPCTVKGCRITLLQRLFQHRRSAPLAFTEKEEECMQAEIQGMLGKQGISKADRSSKGLYSQMFLVPYKDGR